MITDKILNKTMVRDNTEEYNELIRYMKTVEFYKVASPLDYYDLLFRIFDGIVSYAIVYNFMLNDRISVMNVDRDGKYIKDAFTDLVVHSLNETMFASNMDDFPNDRILKDKAIQIIQTSRRFPEGLIKLLDLSPDLDGDNFALNYSKNLRNFFGNLIENYILTKGYNFFMGDKNFFEMLNALWKEVFMDVQLSTLKDIYHEVAIAKDVVYYEFNEAALQAKIFGSIVDDMKIFDTLRVPIYGYRPLLTESKKCTFEYYRNMFRAEDAILNDSTQNYGKYSTELSFDKEYRKLVYLNEEVQTGFRYNKESVVSEAFLHIRGVDTLIFFLSYEFAYILRPDNENARGRLCESETKHYNFVDGKLVHNEILRCKSAHTYFYSLPTYLLFNKNITGGGIAKNTKWEFPVIEDLCQDSEVNDDYQIMLNTSIYDVEREWNNVRNVIIFGDDRSYTYLFKKKFDLIIDTEREIVSDYYMLLNDKEIKYKKENKPSKKYIDGISNK